MKEFFYTGLMGAGKSERLINMVENDESSFIVLNAVFDGETGRASTVTSRNGKSVQSIEILSEHKTDDLKALLYDIMMNQKVQTIYIDEIQFLEPLQIEFIREYLSLLDITIIYFGLETDFTGALFNATKYLIERLNHKQIMYIKRKCEICDNEAEYNARIVNGEVAHSGELFAEQKALYKALCKKHYFSN